MPSPVAAGWRGTVESRSWPAAAREQPATREHRRTPGEETEIPPDPLRGRHRLVDVVNAEDVVVDHTLDQIEAAEADEGGAGEQLGRPARVRPARRPPEDDETGEHED